MIIVTGGAGFIGSCIVARLNDLGHRDLIVVDHIVDHPLKKKNLEGKQFVEYIEKDDFLGRLDQGLPGTVEQVIHMGACSSTTLDDAAHFEKYNFAYSRRLAEWSIENGARMIYASSAATYGDGRHGYDDAQALIPRLEPLNHYGRSKQKFDLWVLEHDLAGRLAGLKFFNVFGPNEYHKADMRSVIAKAWPRIEAEGRMALFKSYRPEYADGEQKRDFIYVRDAVDVVKFFFDRPEANGIFNVGTGRARTWNDLAAALFSAAGRDPNIEYVDMPKSLRPHYQYFTEAKVDKLRNAGYKRPFTPLEDAVQEYVEFLTYERRI